MYQDDYTPGSVANFLSSGKNTSKSQDADVRLNSLFSSSPSTKKELSGSGEKKKKKRQSEGQTDLLQTKVMKKRKVNKLQELFQTAEQKKESQVVHKAKRDGSTGKSGISPASKRKHEEQDHKSGKKKKRKESVDSSDAEAEKKGQSDSDEDAKTDNRAVQRAKKKKFKKDKAKDKRTVFLGNLPNTVSKKQVIRMCKEYGIVESVRFRSAAPADPKLPKKAVIIKKEFHPKRNSFNAYVIFKDTSAAVDALKMNGTTVDGMHIRVDSVAATAVKHDHKRSIFVGSLPFDCKEEALREQFSDCGSIENVRVVRDKQTGLGKGFGYVLFQDTDSVGFALKFHGKKFEGRKLRVEASTQHPTSSMQSDRRKPHTPLPKQHKGKKTLSSESTKERSPKKEKSTERKKLKNIDGSKSTPSTLSFTAGSAKKVDKKKKLKKRLDKKKKVKLSNILQGKPREEKAKVNGERKKKHQDLDGKKKKKISADGNKKNKMADGKRKNNASGKNVIFARNRMAKRMKTKSKR